MNSQVSTYYSNGKLLLSGEYVVLDGALSIALPSTYGQYLKVNTLKIPKIIWKSFDEKANIWFKAEIDIKSILTSCKNVSEKSTSSYLDNVISQTSSKEVSNILFNILVHAQRLNPCFLYGNKGYSITTQLTFPRNWGLGSSSTLINNIAQWAKVDPYDLLYASFPGSGYDIACAQYHHPILYQRNAKNPIVKPAAFYPLFKEQLYFVHLNKKQNSREGIARYHAIKAQKAQTIKSISDISIKIQSAQDLHTFEYLLEKHEDIIANLLKLPTVSSRLFNDYFGKVKSLGAWGGDFILATGNDASPDYFKKKGFHTIIPYSKMVL